MKTFSVLALVMGDELNEHMEKIVPDIKASATSGNNDLIHNSLTILKLAFKNHENPQAFTAAAQN